MDVLAEAVRGLIELWDAVILWYFAVLNTFYGALLVVSGAETWKHWSLGQRVRLSERLPEEALPPVSILVPAYDEAEVIVESVTAQLDLDYPWLQVVVVNDGSSDDTFERLEEAFDLYRVPPAVPRTLETAEVRGYYRSHRAPRLLVVDKENGGKADALNAALNASRYPYFITVDADTIVEKVALRRLARVFVEQDADVVAGAGGTLRVANDCTFERGRPVHIQVPDSRLAAFQVAEYLRAFLFGRVGWNRLGGNLLMSGAFSLYKKSLVLEIGGFETGSVTEDLEVTVALHEHLQSEDVDYAMPFVPDPIAWTEVPEDASSLGSQRERWHRGLISTLFKYWYMVGNPRYRGIGMLAAPFFFFGEMLAPLMEGTGYVVLLAAGLLGGLNVEFAVLFFSLAYGFLVLLAVWSVWLELLTYRVYPRKRDYLKLLRAALMEPFGFRQLTVFWRIKAFWNFFRELHDWGVVERTGLSTTGGGGDGDRPVPDDAAGGPGGVGGDGEEEGEARPEPAPAAGRD